MPPQHRRRRPRSRSRAPTRRSRSRARRHPCVSAGGAPADAGNARRLALTRRNIRHQLSIARGGIARRAKLDIVAACREQALGRGQHREQFWTAEPVERLAPERTALDDAALAHEGEVGGDRGLGEAEMTGQVDNTPLALGQLVHDRESSRVAQTAKQADRGRQVDAAVAIVRAGYHRHQTIIVSSTLPATRGTHGSPASEGRLRFRPRPRVQHLPRCRSAQVEHRSTIRHRRGRSSVRCGTLGRAGRPISQRVATPDPATRRLAEPRGPRPASDGIVA